MYTKIKMNPTNIIRQLPQYRVNLRQCIYLCYMAAIVLILIYLKLETNDKKLTEKDKNLLLNTTKIVKLNQSKLDEINKRIWLSFKDEQKQNWVN